MTGATPRPWRASEAAIIDASDREVATVPQTLARGAQAAHDLALRIVAAVNAHDELVMTLRAIMAALDQPAQNSGLEDPGTCRILRGDAAHAWGLARAALARIKAESKG